MAGAPPNRGAPIPLPLLILILLLPGCFCWATPESCGGGECTVPPAPPPSRRSPEPVTVRSNSSVPDGCPPAGGAVTVEGGPTSRTATVGDSFHLECVFRAPPEAQVVWYRVCPLPHCQNRPGLEEAARGAILTFQRLTPNHTGLYYCRVQAGRDAGQSCGTFLRVREPPAVPFLNIRESTKNRIITAEGILLLLCAVGPGLLLLFRKRWANERLLQMKKALEEENLYEGLNLDECSMYEDISRGLQPTYQDVGSLHPTDTQLEKP